MSGLKVGLKKERCLHTAQTIRWTIRYSVYKQKVAITDNESLCLTV